MVEPEAREIHLREYLAVVRQRIWLVILAILAVVVPTAVVLIRQEPVYEASTRVLIEQTRLPLQDQYALGPGIDPEIEKTLLLSRPVMSSVLQRLDPYFTRLSEKHKEAAIASLTSSIEIRFHKKKGYSSSQSALATITVRGRDPQRVAKVANLVTQTYIDETRKRELSQATASIEWLKQQLAEMRQKVKKAEQRFQAYKLEKGIIGLEERKNELASKMQAASTEHLNVKMRRMEAELALTSLKKAMAAGAVAATAAFISFGSDVIKNLKARLDEARAELSNKLAIFKPKHQVIVDLKNKIQLLQRQIADQEAEIIKSQKIKVQSLRARERALAKTLDAYKQEVQKLNPVELQYSILEREVTASRDLYNLLMERQKKSSLESSVGRRQISIVEAATVPFAPAPKKIPLKLLVAAVIGIMIGSGLAFLLEYLDTAVKTPDDVERHLGLWATGMIPRFRPELEPVLGLSFALKRGSAKKSGADR